MVKIDWQRYLPLGVDWDVIRNVLLKKALMFALVWSAKAPIATWISWSNMFAYTDNQLVIYKEMADIVWVMQGSLYGILLLAAAMPFLALYFYSLHFQGSKSIYTMRRLPKRGELLRRCITVPLLMMAVCFALIPVLRIVYYGIYVLATPRGHLLPGQWQLLWEGFLC